MPFICHVHVVMIRSAVALNLTGWDSWIVMVRVSSFVILFCQVVMVGFSVGSVVESTVIYLVSVIPKFPAESVEYAEYSYTPSARSVKLHASLPELQEAPISCCFYFKERRCIPRCFNGAGGTIYKTG